MFWKYLLAWIPIVLLAIVNGGLHRIYEPTLCPTLAGNCPGAVLPGVERPHGYREYSCDVV